MANHGDPASPRVAEPVLLSEKEAARILGFSHRTLQAWRVQGGGPAFIRVSTRCVRYRMEDLERWIADRVRTSTSDDGSARG